MKRMTPTLAICCAAVLAAVGAAIFDLGANDAPAGVYGGGATVTIKDYTFGPALVTPGVVVTFKNLDDAPHSMTSDKPGLFDTGSVKGGSSATFTAPSAPGEYTFFCSIHTNIHGKLVVATG